MNQNIFPAFALNKMNRIRNFFSEEKDFIIIQMPLLFLIGVVLGYFSRRFYASVNSFSQNEISILGTTIGSLGTIIAASLGVWVAFSQIKKQFEHKVIHDAWVDFQKHLFDYSNCQSDLDTKIQWLTYFVKNYSNPLVNKGNANEYRTETWNNVSNAFQALLQSFALMLRSFETHEVVFLRLTKMKKEFYREFNIVVFDKYLSFIKSVFPEFYGKKSTLTTDELVTLINDYWYELSKVSGYLNDFRIALQNETVGRILNKRIPTRNPTVKSKILTMDGFINFSP